MRLITRRAALAVGGTLAVTGVPGKPHAETLPSFARKLTLTDPPAQPPETTFYDAEDDPHTLAAFKGRGMVINFWATWCAPCVAEMPALAELARALAPHDVAVLPLSSDRGGAPTVRGWLEGRGLQALPVLLDPKGTMARAWGVRGLPTTVIIDRQGRDRARLEGAVDWAAPDVAKRILELVS